jgi:hypothetical protein
MGLLTGHCHLNRQLFKLKLIDNPVCSRCKQAFEMALYVLCDCEPLATLGHLGQHFLKPDDFGNISVSRVLHFVQDVGLSNG